MWDDLLRVAASVQGGHAAAALVVGKLCSSRWQQNALTSAIKEYGALRRTVYAARYLADETYRRRIARQLNKGENLHALRCSLAYAGEGALRRRHHEQQTEQMWCLTLATKRDRLLVHGVPRPRRGRPAPDRPRRRRRRRRRSGFTPPFTEVNYLRLCIQPPVVLTAGPISTPDYDEPPAAARAACSIFAR
jgi:hypothetical protein